MNWIVFTALYVTLAMSLPGLAHADLVSNGGFEQDVIDSSNDPVTPPAGWTVLGTSPNIGVDSSNPNSGLNEAFLGTIGGTGTLQQTLTTTAGTTYVVSFALENQGGPITGTNSFQATFGGSSLLTLSNAPTDFGYNLYSFNVTASGVSTLLAFNEQNDEFNWFLDDVSVNAIGVPEPSSGILFGTALAACTLLFRRQRR